MPTPKFNSQRSPVLSTRGMVACTQPLASEAGLRILKEGGNAADAAVAIAAALNVTEPSSTGLGGDAFVMYYDSQTKNVRCMLGCGKSPQGLTMSAVREKGIKGQEMPPFHALTVMVPGAAMLWEDTINTFGTLTLESVLAPAIELAEGGFPVAPITAKQWQDGEFQLKGPGKKALLNAKNKPPSPGEVMRNKDLGRTLRKLAMHGARNGFYKGEIAKAIVNVVKSMDGVLDQVDLDNHKSVEVEPLCTNYRGYKIWEIPPPTQGLVVLMALNHLESFGNISDLEWSSADRLHSQIEAIRLAFFDALQYNADPDVMPTPVDLLLKKEYAEKRRRECGMGSQAMELKIDDQKPDVERSIVGGSDTVYFSVVDGEGNGCSFINSTYMGFGTGIVPDGCGFTLQNRGHNFILEEQHPNCLGPCKRPYHTLIPGICTKENGDLHAVFGVMGAFMQPQGHLQVISNLLDFGMDPQSALDAPRFCVNGVDSSVGPSCVDKSRVLLEEGIGAKEARELIERGHSVIDGVSGDDRYVFGKGQIIVRDDNGVLWAGSEPRADGMAMGF